MSVAGNWLVVCSMGGGMAMRALVVAMMVIQAGLGRAAYAENPPPSVRSIGEALPLFDKNHCVEVKDPADLLFCGDPELNDAAPRLSRAIEGRLDRLSDRRLAIEENAEWIKNRNASCGIFGNQAVSDRDIEFGPAMPVEGDRGENRDIDQSELRLPGRRYDGRNADMQRA